VSYATRSDLAALGVNEDVLGDISPDTLEASLSAASLLADSYLRGKVGLPLKPGSDGTYPLDLRRAVCQIATHDLLSVRGYASEGDEANIRRRAEAARDWLEDIGAGAVKPAWVDSSDDGATGYDGPFVLGPDGSAPSPRGF
jgi:phage gp36-like protein